jgi:hypothetical protein
MCRVLCLSESGYYRWLRNREKRNRRQLLAVKIDAILAEHPDMLIFVIMGGQWMDGFFGEPSARAVNSPPPSCYKDSIEQVAPAMPRARHEPN